MDAFDAIGDAQLRSTLLFVRAKAAAVSADEVARALDVPRSAARARLEKLLAAGLLVAAFERRSGRGGPGAGRPAKTYAPAAETTQLEFPHRRYETLLALLIRVLPPRGRKRLLRQAGAAYGQELARAGGLRRGNAVRPALERVCRSLGELGFHAAVDAVGPHEAVLRSATCPLRPLVVADAEATSIDEAMWRRLIKAAFEPGRVGRVTCRTHDCHLSGEPCTIVVAFALEG